jgi:hypothetical protein
MVNGLLGKIEFWTSEAFPATRNQSLHQRDRTNHVPIDHPVGPLIWNRPRYPTRFLPRLQRGGLVVASSIVVVKRIPWAKSTPAPGG